MVGLTVKQAATELQVTDKRVYQLIKSGILHLNDDNKITAESVVERKANPAPRGRPQGTFKR